MRHLLQVHRAPVQPVPRCQGQLPKLSHASSVYSTWRPLAAFHPPQKSPFVHLHSVNWVWQLCSALTIMPAGVRCGAAGFFASYLTAAIKRLSVLMSLVVTEQQFHCHTLSPGKSRLFFFHGAISAGSRHDRCAVLKSMGKPPQEKKRVADVFPLRSCPLLVCVNAIHRSMLLAAEELNESSFCMTVTVFCLRDKEKKNQFPWCSRCENDEESEEQHRSGRRRGGGVVILSSIAILPRVVFFPCQEPWSSSRNNDA